MLTASQIKEEVFNKNIIINPFDESKLNPNSYNLSLSKHLLIYENEVLDSKQDNPTISIDIPKEGFTLKKGELYLGSTIERTTVKNLIPVLNGRSSIGRLGLFIHVSAGFGDIGFDGTWTLELYPTKDIIVYEGMRICQICFHKPDGLINSTYKGKYQSQVLPTKSRLFTEFS